MQRVKLPWQSIVLVCDGRKALIFENIGDAELVNLKTVRVLEHELAATRAMGSDRPGRVHESAGSAHSAVDQTDWHDQAETAFIKDAAKALDDAVHAKGAKDVVIAAAPRAMGVLRDALPKGVRALVRAEVPKDLVHLSTGEIENAFAGL